MGEKVRRGEGQLAMMHDTSIRPKWREGENTRKEGICQEESPGRFQSSHRFEPRNPSDHANNTSIHAGSIGYPPADTLDNAPPDPRYCREASRPPSDATTPFHPPPASPPFRTKWTVARTATRHSLGTTASASATPPHPPPPLRRSRFLPSLIREAIAFSLVWDSASSPTLLRKSYLTSTTSAYPEMA